MLKILISLLLLSSLALCADKKATGCELSQVGDVEFSLGSKSYKKADYKAVVASGKNFKTIFVGSTISVDDVVAKIVDIKADKRVSKARTGVITLDVNSQIVAMKYYYKSGHFSAKGNLKDGTKIGFVLEVKALLCHAK